VNITKILFTSITIALLLTFSACATTQSGSNRANIVFGDGNPDDWNKQEWEFSCYHDSTADNSNPLNSFVSCLIPAETECEVRYNDEYTFYKCGDRLIGFNGEKGEVHTLDESGEPNGDSLRANLTILSPGYIMEVHYNDARGSKYCVIRGENVDICNDRPTGY
jgi:hypothetical protein